MDTYLALDELEQAAYRARLQAEGADTMEATKLTWADKILLQGIERGREEGAVLANRGVTLSLKRSRFVDLPADLVARLERADSASLDVALDQLLKVETAAALLAVLPTSG